MGLSKKGQLLVRVKLMGKKKVHTGWVKKVSSFALYINLKWTLFEFKDVISHEAEHKPEDEDHVFIVICVIELSSWKIKINKK